MSRHDVGAQALSALLQAHWPGLRCEWLASVSSTNTVLAERARSASFVPTLLVADEQTQGRGRLGRQWRSEPGASLTFSVALPVDSADWSGFSLAIGVALAESLSDPAGTPALRLKWPNDLWLVDEKNGAGRKLGGILVESIASKAVGRVAVIGIGLNLLPRAGLDLSSGHASLFELWNNSGAAMSLTPAAVLERAAPGVLDAVRQFTDGGFGAFAARYARADLLKGHSVYTTGAASDSISGIADGIDSSTGALRVLTADGLRLVASSEVSVRLGTASARLASTTPDPVR